MDSYNVVALDEISRNYTTFITESHGRLRYTRLPQGYASSKDIYNSSYEEVIRMYLKR